MEALDKTLLETLSDIKTRFISSGKSSIGRRVLRCHRYDNPKISAILNKWMQCIY